MAIRLFEITIPESNSDSIREIENGILEYGIQKVVVGIRHNPGGNINSSSPLFELLSENEHINQPGKLFIIMGRNTFSAATLFAVDLEEDMHAIFVGEPTGGRPNLYGDPIPVRLPNSGISIMVSTIFWKRSDPDDDRDWIEPDIPAPLSSSDYFNGIDPALDAITGYGN